MLHHRTAVTHCVVTPVSKYRLRKRNFTYIHWQTCCYNTQGCTIVKTKTVGDKMDVLGISCVRTLLFLLFIGVCESQDERSVRILDGPREGRVEIYFNDQWSTVSPNGWTETEAKVVCRELGFDGPADIMDPGPAPVATSVPKVSVKCLTDAEPLQNCNIETTAGEVYDDPSLDYLVGQEFWEHTENAGVRCKNAVTTTGVNFVTIVINVLGVLILIAVICIFLFIFYRFKKSHAAKESKPVGVTQESVAMYSTQISKAYADNPADPADQYCSINPIPVEEDNAYLELNQGDVPQQV